MDAAELVWIRDFQHGMSSDPWHHPKASPMWHKIEFQWSRRKVVEWKLTLREAEIDFVTEYSFTEGKVWQHDTS